MLCEFVALRRQPLGEAFPRLYTYVLRFHVNGSTLLQEIGHKTKFMACDEAAMVSSPMNVNRGIPLVVNKKRFVIGCFLLTTFSVTGCQTDAELLASERESASQTALRRGQFELDCPQATATPGRLAV